MTSFTGASARVAIVIRTKDRPLLLERAIDDILAQTLSAWEAIIVNDGGDPVPIDSLVRSRDAALAGRLAVIHLPWPAGMEAASNAGMGATATEFVVIHDDDDTWHPRFLEETVSWLGTHPDRPAVAVATTIVIEQIDDGVVREISREPITIPHDTLSLFDLVLGNRIPPIGMVFRRAAAEASGGFDESLPVLGDWEFTLRIAAQAPIGYLAGTTLAFWHQRPDSGGVVANSVHGARLLHSQTDRELRDRALRTYISDHGDGGLLYLARFVDERVAATEEALTQRIAASEHATLERLSDLERAMNDRFPADREKRIAQIDAIVHGHVQYHSPAATLRRFVSRAARPLRRRA